MQREATGGVPTDDAPAVDLTALMRSMWLQEQIDPGSTVNHLGHAFHLLDDIDVARLEDAVRAVLDRHPMLRGVVDLEPDGRPVMRPVNTPATVLSTADASTWSRSRLTSEVERLFDEQFDVGAGPLYRFACLTISDHDHLFVMVMHHLITDMWSMSLMFGDIMKAYVQLGDEGEISLRQTSSTFERYVAAERRLIDTELGDEHRRFWSDYLADLPDQPGVPVDHPAGPETGTSGGVVVAELGADRSQAVRDLAKELDGTPHDVLLAIYEVALMRYTGAADLTVATVKAQRSARTALVQGCMLNPVILRTRLDPDGTCADAVRAVSDTVRAASEFDAYPLQQILEELHPQRADILHPFARNGFLWQKTTRMIDAEFAAAQSLGRIGVRADFSGVTVESDFFGDRPTSYPLILLVAEIGDGLTLSFNYMRDLYEQETISAFARCVDVLIDAFVADPAALVSGLPLMSDRERNDLIALGTGERRPIPDGGVHTWFETVAAANPTSVAVRFGRERITYRELDRWAGRFAVRLGLAGVQHGDLVGIHVDRSIGMIASILGTWKAGAAYVPLDPGFPEDRLQMMVDDAGLRAIVVDRGTERDFGRVPTIPIGSDSDGDVGEHAAPHGAGAPTRVDSADLAYVLFTSGSSGRPKGVMVEHRNVVNLLSSMRERPGLSDRDVMLATTTLSFDISVLELFLPLVVGAEVVVLPRAHAADPLELGRVLEQVSVAQATPTTWRLLTSSGWTGAPDLTVLCGGEPLPSHLAAELLTRSGSVWNMYGPTETTVWSAVGRIDEPEAEVSIGEPIAATTLHVLDARGELLPPGAEGELVIGGDGVARGYIGRPDLTDARFVADPRNPGRVMYRTGDRVVRRPGGALIHLGRMDDQIKLRGHRIELGEIEHALATHPDVSLAAATTVTYADDDERLVAYVTSVASDTLLDPVALRAHVHQLLPDYMVPAAIRQLDRIPLTPNNKLDRRRLPTWRHATSESGQGSPASPLEAAVAAIWAEVLAIDVVDRDDNFFDLGGHSLLATRIASQVRGLGAGPVDVRTVLEHPTVRQLSAAVTSDEHREHALPELVHVDDDADAPLGFSQERMWFLHLLNPDSAAYNIAGGVWLDGEIDLDAMAAAIDLVVARHDSLRTRFVAQDGDPVQVVESTAPVVLERIDCSQIPRSSRDEQIVELMRQQAERPFRLDELPLIRFVMFRAGPDRHAMFVSMHHIVSDLWSFVVLSREVAATYTAIASGDEPALPEQRVQLRDYTRWHRALVERHHVDDQLAYWTAQLQGLRPIELPVDHPRPELLSPRGASHVTPIPSHVGSLLDDFCRTEQVTAFMAYLAAFDLLLAAASHSDDIAVGTAIANRNWVDSESLIGSLVNSLVVRNRVDPTRSFREFTQSVSATALDAYAHQDVPFARLVTELEPARDTSRSPLFQVFFNVQTRPFGDIELPGIDTQLIPVDRSAAQFELSLTIDPVEQLATWEYSTDLFCADRIERLADRYWEITESALSAPDAPIGTLPGFDGWQASRLRPAKAASPSDTPRAEPSSSDTPRAEPSPSDTPRAEPSSSGPPSELEPTIAAIWSEVLRVDHVDRDDNFFELGGHSLVAVRMFARLDDELGRRLPLTTLFRAPTVAGLAAAFDADAAPPAFTSLVPVRPEGTTTPLFYVSPFLITALSMNSLAEHLDPDVPFFVLQPQGMEWDDDVHTSIPDMAEHYISEMRQVQPSGPYSIGGHCAGSWVAFEIARQLQDAGENVAHLVLVDSEPPHVEPPSAGPIRRLVERVGYYARDGRLLPALAWQLGLVRERHLIRWFGAGDEQRAAQVRATHAVAHAGYEAAPISGDATLIRSGEFASLSSLDWHARWSELLSGSLEIDVVPGTHAGLVEDDSARHLAEAISAALRHEAATGTDRHPLPPGDVSRRPHPAR